MASRVNTAGFNLILSCLAPANQEWAQNASVLMVTSAVLKMLYNGAQNSYAMHDLGLATSNLLIQAQAMGLVSHAMGGFDHGQIRKNLSIPDSQQLVTVVAVGLPGSLDSLNEKNRERQLSPRVRKSIDDILVELR